jgi:hypothetical protein
MAKHVVLVDMLRLVHCDLVEVWVLPVLGDTELVLAPDLLTPTILHTPVPMLLLLLLVLIG